jgi:hypothetical protein
MQQGDVGEQEAEIQANTFGQTQPVSAHKLISSSPLAYDTCSLVTASGGPIHGSPW